MKKLPDYLVFSTDVTKGLLYSQWLKSVSSSEYREGLVFLLEVLMQQNITLWLHDDKLMPELDVQDQKWITEEFGLLLAGSPLRYLAVLAPEAEAGLQTAKAIREKVYRVFGKSILVDFFTDEETAIAWLLPNLQYYRLSKPLDNSSELAST